MTLKSEGGKKHWKANERMETILRAKSDEICRCRRSILVFLWRFSIVFWIIPRVEDKMLIALNWMCVYLLVCSQWQWWFCTFQMAQHETWINLRVRRSSNLLKQLRQRRVCRFLSANLTMKHLRILAQLTFLQPMTSIRFLVRRGKQQPQQQKQEQTQLTVQSVTEQHFVHVTFFFASANVNRVIIILKQCARLAHCRTSFAGETSRGGFSPSPSRWKLLISWLITRHTPLSSITPRPRGHCAPKRWIKAPRGIAALFPRSAKIGC